MHNVTLIHDFKHLSRNQISWKLALWLPGSTQPQVSSFYHSEMTPKTGLMNSLANSSPLPKVYISTGIIIHLFLTIQGILNRFTCIQETCKLQPSPFQITHLPLWLLSNCTTVKTHCCCLVLRKSTGVIHVQFNISMSINQQSITFQIMVHGKQFNPIKRKIHLRGQSSPPR